MPAVLAGRPPVEPATLSCMAAKKSTAQERKIPVLPGAFPPCLVTAQTLEQEEPVEGCRVEGVDLNGCRLGSLRVESSVLERVSFAGCEAGPVRLRDVRLVKCDFSNAVLRHFEATRVEFVDCRLIGMQAVGCRWTSVLFDNCDARYTQMNEGQLRLCETRGSNFAECDLRHTDLEGTIFSQTGMQRADLNWAKLRDTDLRGAEIEGITVRGEDLRGAIVTPDQAIGLAALLGLVIR